METQNKDLEFLKNYEKKLKEYREKEEHFKKSPTSYKHLTYQVKNPFKGI